MRQCELLRRFKGQPLERPVKKEYPDRWQLSSIPQENAFVFLGNTCLQTHTKRGGTTFFCSLLMFSIQTDFIIQKMLNYANTK